MLVICVGLKRAASTLQYQLCKAILKTKTEFIDFGYTRFEKKISNALDLSENKNGIIKTHFYFDIYPELSLREDVYFLLSYRDLREASMSVMEAYNISFKKLINDKWLESELDTFSRFKKINKILFQNYSLLKEDMKSVIEEIVYFLKIEINQALISEICNEYSIDSQLSKIKSYKKTKQYKIIRMINNVFNTINPTPYFKRGLIFNKDQSTTLHYNHINTKNKNWQTYFSEDQIAVIKPIICDWLIENGYEKDYNW